MAVPTDEKTTHDAIRLLLAIARLGEADLRGWWRGHALDGIGQYVIAGMFPRTARPAALELDIAAATRMHAELLGRATALHLFSDRLPFRQWTIAWLAEQKTAVPADPLLDVLEPWSEPAATDAVRGWCLEGGADDVRGEPRGACLLLGRLGPSGLDDPARMQRTACTLAHAYLDQTGPLRPPYFDLAR